MHKALSFVSLTLTTYCVGCGAGGGDVTPATSTTTDPALNGRSAAAPTVSTPGAAAPWSTRITGRPAGRARPASLYFATHQKEYQAPPLDPAAPVQGKVAVAEAPKVNGDGQTFDITLKGNAFAQKIEGGGVDVSFDPQVLEVLQVTVDKTAWEFFSSGGQIDNANGHVKNIAFASFAGQSGTFPIATVTVRSKGPGERKLHLSESLTSPFASSGHRVRVGLD